MLNEIIEEIGEENIVQVVTYSASAYVSAGELLMAKRNKLFWNPCAAHEMDLMLEDIGKLSIFKDVIGKAKRVCKFIYNHLWMLNLFRQQTGQRELKKAGCDEIRNMFSMFGKLKKKVCLKMMFGSKKWLESNFARNDEGMTVMSIIIRDDGFWKKVKYCLTATTPLVKVLKLVDGDVKPTMRYIYEAMDHAKEKITSSFGNKLKWYENIWDIIDQMWKLQLHRLLHAMAYYLNPK
jgi:Protein of unknown function (DUF 659)